MTRIVACGEPSLTFDAAVLSDVEAPAAIWEQLENSVVMPGCPAARCWVTVSVMNFGFATTASISTSSCAVPALPATTVVLPSGVCPSPEPLMSQASLENSSTV